MPQRGPRRAATRGPAAVAVDRQLEPVEGVVTKSGMTFAGYWFGPYVFAPRVMHASTPYVRTRPAPACRRLPSRPKTAWTAQRRILGAAVRCLDITVALVRRHLDEPGAVIRCPARKTYVPRTSVSMNSRRSGSSGRRGPRRRSSRRCRSLLLRGRPRPRRGSRPRGLVRHAFEVHQLPEYVSLSRTTAWSPRAAMSLTKCER